jgi:crotonobetainyl-CoA:carnitine CoA-transferase CaiB-like acyl-CoA transferase
VATEYFEVLRHEDAGVHGYPGLMWRALGTPNRLRTAPCRLGEHNDYVYRDILGYSDEEVRRLTAEGHIGTEYAQHLR